MNAVNYANLSHILSQPNLQNLLSVSNLGTLTSSSPLSNFSSFPGFPNLVAINNNLESGQSAPGNSQSQPTLIPIYFPQPGQPQFAIPPLVPPYLISQFGAPPAFNNYSQFLNLPGQIPNGQYDPTQLFLNQQALSNLGLAHYSPGGSDLTGFNANLLKVNFNHLYCTLHYYRGLQQNYKCLNNEVLCNLDKITDLTDLKLRISIVKLYE